MLLKIHSNISIYDPDSKEENPSLESEYNFIDNIDRVDDYDWIIKGYEFTTLKTQLAKWLK